jgi:hypothetical protein
MHHLVEAVQPDDVDGSAVRIKVDGFVGADDETAAVVAPPHLVDRVEHAQAVHRLDNLGRRRLA